MDNWRERKLGLQQTVASCQQSPRPHLLHDEDYGSSSDKSYCGERPSDKNPGPFDIMHYSKQCKTKQYNLWANLQDNEQPPAKFMDM